MYSTEILLNTAAIRNVNLTEMTQILRRGKHRITSHYSDKLKTTSKLSQLQNTQLNLLTVTFLDIVKRTEINLRWVIVTCVRSANQTRGFRHPARSDASEKNKYRLFAGQEVRIGKNCGRGLEYGPRQQAESRTQARRHSFSQYGPT